MHITQVPSGINLVIETQKHVFFGRFRDASEGRVRLRKAAAEKVPEGAKRERFIRKTALYGFPAEHEDLVLAQQGIVRVRRLGEVPKGK